MAVLGVNLRVTPFWHFNFNNLTFFVRVSSLTPPTTSRGNFHIFSPELIVLDPLNVRDDIETNSGVKIPVSRSDMSFQSERE